MQKYKFCPRCGSKILPNASFCGQCGYSFTKHQQSQTNNNYIHQAPNAHQVKSSMPLQQPSPHPPISNMSRAHYVRWILLVIILLAIGIGGYYETTYYYKNMQDNPTTISQRSTSNNSNNNNNESNNNSSNSLSSQSIQAGLKEIWDETEAEANEGECDNPTSYFKGGNSNHDYKTLMSWADDMHKPGSGVESVRLAPHVRSVSKSNDSVIVKYEVGYIFHNDNGKHYQGFNWTAKLVKDDDNWVIAKNKANNKHPVYDHN